MLYAFVEENPKAEVVTLHHELTSWLIESDDAAIGRLLVNVCDYDPGADGQTLQEWANDVAGYLGSLIIA